MTVKYLFLFLFSIVGTSICGQNVRRAVYVEFGGASRGVGIFYDARLPRYAHWGYRVGLSYSEETGNYDLISDNGLTHGVGIPAEFHLLIGGRRHYFELGQGINVGLYQDRYYGAQDLDASAGLGKSLAPRHAEWGYFFYNTLAYRYQAREGAFLHIGLTPSYSFGGNHAVHTVAYGSLVFVGFGLAF